jgi:hypothetical protein
VTPLVVLILAVMWVLVLVPPLLRSRTDGRPSASVGSFHRQLATLSRTTPGRLATGRPAAAPVRYGRPPPVPAPPSHRRAGRPMRPAGGVSASTHLNRVVIRRRRQHVLLTLVMAAAVTAVIGFGMSVRPVAMANVVVDPCLVLYVYLLVQRRRVEEQRALRYSWSAAA